MLAPTHIKKHGISTAEYKRLFPNDVLRIQAPESRAKASATKLGKPNLALRGKKQSPEHIAAISKSLSEGFKSGRLIHWNTGNTTSAEVKAKISAGNKLAGNIGNERQREKKQERMRAGAAARSCQILSIDEESGRATAECLVCGANFSFTHQVFYEPKKLCPVCEPRLTFRSTGEEEVTAFIRQEYAGLIIPNDRELLGGHELDVYLPELKLGIEYTGLFWHAEKQKPERLHLLWKMQFAGRLGVRVITIYEDEWKLKRAIVESRLRAILKTIQHRVHARVCRLVRPNVQTKNRFLVQNHLQGADTASDWIAFEHHGKLVAIGTFKRTKSGTELSRFATSLNTVVPGAASRIINWFKRTHNEPLISYADLRWSTGELYRTLGFELVARIEPSYWYLTAHIKDACAKTP